MSATSQKHLTPFSEVVAVKHIPGNTVLFGANIHKDWSGTKFGKLRPLKHPYSEPVIVQHIEDTISPLYSSRPGLIFRFSTHPRINRILVVHPGLSYLLVKSINTELKIASGALKLREWQVRKDNPRRAKLLDGAVQRSLAILLVCSQGPYSLADSAYLEWYRVSNFKYNDRDQAQSQDNQYLFSRILAKEIYNGRFDTNATVLDEKGELIVLIKHVSLVQDMGEKLSEELRTPHKL
ncbi:hypothetical protein B0O99DRAFT_589645 [Bisporella sp. PMI_857]|nr:hypothetical protein B0O99DRAFT_589645 [Bisporella sp. PMI_857]